MLGGREVINQLAREYSVGASAETNTVHAQRATFMHGSHPSLTLDAADKIKHTESENYFASGWKVFVAF